MVAARLTRRLAKHRLYRFVRWYRRLRRPLDAETDLHLSRRFALRVAWHWSSDLRAFLRRSKVSA